MRRKTKRQIDRREKNKNMEIYRRQKAYICCSQNNYNMFLMIWTTKHHMETDSRTTRKNKTRKDI